MNTPRHLHAPLRRTDGSGQHTRMAVLAPIVAPTSVPIAQATGELA